MKRLKDIPLIYGKDNEKNSLSIPCIFKATDTDTTYLGDGSVFSEVGGGGGGTTLVASIKSTFANLPESEIGQIHFITDLGFGGGKGNPVVTGGGTTGAAIWDGTDWLQL